MNYDDINDTKFSKTICFCSWRDDIDYVNSGLDIMTLTSLNEGTPVSLIEAQASSLPIVTLNVGGVQDIVLENKSALLANSRQEFFLKLLECTDNIRLRQELSLNGEKFAFSRFGKDRLVKDIVNLYNKNYGLKFNQSK